MVFEWWRFLLFLWGTTSWGLLSRYWWKCVDENFTIWCGYCSIRGAECKLVFGLWSKLSFWRYVCCKSQFSNVCGLWSKVKLYKLLQSNGVESVTNSITDQLTTVSAATTKHTGHNSNEQFRRDDETSFSVSVELFAYMKNRMEVAEQVTSQPIIDEVMDNSRKSKCSKN